MPETVGGLLRREPGAHAHRLTVSRLRQAEAWKNPEVLWIDGGHMTFPLAMESIVSAMKRMPKVRG